jgi:HEAT repeat protein
VKPWRDLVAQARSVLDRPAKPEERSAAARQLIALATEDEFAFEAGAVWTRMLADSQEEVRRAGLEIAIRFTPWEEAENILGPFVTDPSALVRVQAAGALADLERPSCQGVLRGLLQDLVPSIRFEAARGLAAIGDASGIEVLTESLEKGELRFRALGALASLGDSRALPAIQSLFNRFWLPPYERTQAAGALAKLGDVEAAHYLLGRTEKRRGVDRAFAIELCGEVKAPTAPERLKAILGNEAEECRGAAARGLGRLGDPSAMPALLAVMEDETQSDDLRLDAAEGICRLGGPQVRAHVESLLASLHAADARQEARELLEEWT